MHPKTTITATLFALFSTTLATPPGCLLGAVNSFDNPSDIKSICSSYTATQTIQKFCGDATKMALEAFADTCGAAGVKVSTDVPKSEGLVSSTQTASTSPSASGSRASASGSGSVMGQASGSASSSGNGSGNGPAATGSARGSGTGAAGAGASGTASGSAAQATGAAGRIEVGVLAVVAGLVVFGL